MKKNKLIYICGLLLVFFVTFFVYLYKVDRLKIFENPACPDCNIVLVSLDTLGSNHLPCYGYERNTAPNLCKFAKENILFTNSYSNASWTLPSHFSIFTSLYPRHHGMITYSKDHSGNLNRDTKTITEILSNKGYDTMFVGPTDDNGLDLKRGLGRGFDTVVKYTEIDSWQTGYDRLIKNNKEGKKTFLFLHTYMVHQPYLSGDYSSKRLYAKTKGLKLPLTKEELHTYDKGFHDYILDKMAEADTYKTSSYSQRQSIREEIKNAPNLKEAEALFDQRLSREDRLNYYTDYYYDLLSNNPDLVPYAKDLYDEMIFYLDRELATLIDLVKREDLAKNTILIFTSDHGEEFLEHGVVAHPVDHLYNTTTSSVLTMSVPGINQRRIDSLVEGVDIMPTVLDLVGVKSPEKIDGISMKKLIFNEKNPQIKQYLISQGSNDSIRDKRWKLYVNYFSTGATNEYELYDLEKDPGEKTNLAEKEPLIVDALFENLSRIIYKK